jgi:hypothetical protein
MLFIINTLCGIYFMAQHLRLPNKRQMPFLRELLLLLLRQRGLLAIFIMALTACAALKYKQGYRGLALG